MYRHKFFLSLLMFLTIPAFADSHRPEDFLKEITGKKNEGEQILQHFCSNCHAEKPVIQLGAPRTQSLDDWLPRIKKGGDLLFKNSSEGINAMPPRGGCFECSDKQLVLAILAMLPEVIKKEHKKELVDLIKIK